MRPNIAQRKEHPPPTRKPAVTRFQAPAPRTDPHCPPLPTPPPPPPPRPSRPPPPPRPSHPPRRSRRLHLHDPLGGPAAHPRQRCHLPRRCRDHVQNHPARLLLPHRQY